MSGSSEVKMATLQADCLAAWLLTCGTALLSLPRCLAALLHSRTTA